MSTSRIKTIGITGLLVLSAVIIQAAEPFDNLFAEKNDCDNAGNYGGYNSDYGYGYGYGSSAPGGYGYTPGTGYGYTAVAQYNPTSSQGYGNSDAPQSGYGYGNTGDYGYSAGYGYGYSNECHPLETDNGGPAGPAIAITVPHEHGMLATSSDLLNGNSVLIAGQLRSDFIAFLDMVLATSVESPEDPESPLPEFVDCGANGHATGNECMVVGAGPANVIVERGSFESDDDDLDCDDAVWVYPAGGSDADWLTCLDVLGAAGIGTLSSNNVEYRLGLLDYIVKALDAILPGASAQTIPGDIIPGDADSDTVPDAEDDCPAEFGLPPTGCPPGPIAPPEAPVLDTDGDGVLDVVDDCPSPAGWTSDEATDADGDGCRDADEDLDDDNDGFPDASDPCPTEANPLPAAVGGNGCPVAAVVPLGQVDVVVKDAAGTQVDTSTVCTAYLVDSDSAEASEGMTSNFCADWNNKAFPWKVLGAKTGFTKDVALVTNGVYSATACYSSTFSAVDPAPAPLGEEPCDTQAFALFLSDLGIQMTNLHVSTPGGIHAGDTVKIDFQVGNFGLGQDDYTLTGTATGAGLTTTIEKSGSSVASSGLVDAKSTGTGFTAKVVIPSDFGSDSFDVSLTAASKLFPALDATALFSVYINGVDHDQDGIDDYLDNCDLVANLDQLNTDGDAEGDACDMDDDNDGINDALDACPIEFPSGLDTDGDGCSDASDTDDDGDGVLDVNDSCPLGATGWTSSSATDVDGDGCRDDTEDADDDNDGVLDVNDSCPTGATGWTSSSTTDFDGDGCKDDTEDADDDNDGVLDVNDSCPTDPHSTSDGCVAYIDQVTGLAATVSSSTGISLTWSVPGSNVVIANYEVYQATSTGVSVTSSLVGSPASPAHSDAGLITGTTYYYAVRATDGSGLYGTLSSEASATPATPSPPPGPPSIGDVDGDGVPDNVDNCPTVTNSDQKDLDGDGIGDVCDSDLDGDGVPNASDALPDDPTESVDSDGDGVGNNADKCPGHDDKIDANGNGIPDGCDTDRDGDGVPNDRDLFPDNPAEWADSDGDGVGDNSDKCFGFDDRKDLDGDGIPDGCDPDRDGDGRANDNDKFPDSPAEWADSDGDGIGDNSDNCPAALNAGQADLDGDGIGDACDSQNDLLLDLDGDGLIGEHELALGTDPTIADTDGDGIPDGVEVALGTDPLNPNDPTSKPLRAISLARNGLVYTFFESKAPGVEHFKGFQHTHPKPLDGVVKAQSGKTIYSLPPHQFVHPDEPTATVHQDSIMTVRLGQTDDYDASRAFKTAKYTATGLDLSDCVGKPDSDGDGLCDELELLIGTDPNNADTDGDGVSDGAEVTGANPSNPWSSDTDGDGVQDSMDTNAVIPDNGPNRPGLFTEWSLWVGMALLIGCLAVMVASAAAFARRRAAAN